MNPPPPPFLSRVLISDDINASQQAPATITPAQFATATSAGWAPVSASTTVATPTSMTIPTSGTWTLQVASTSGFDVSQPIVLATATSSLSINCTGPTIPGSTIAGPGTSFTGCSSSSGGVTTVPGLTVSQPAAVSAVTLSVFQPGSSDAYTLTATPRSYTPSGQPASGPGLGAPALLTLGGGDTINATTTQVKLTVNGTVAINSGTLTCTGSLAIVSAYGYGASSGPSAFSPSTCATGGPTTTQPNVPDPYASLLPTFSQFPAKSKQAGVIGSGGACGPGDYTVAFNCKTLTPGVYVLDAGLGTTSISMASGFPGQGVLLYLRNGSINMTGSQTLNLPPLSAQQAVQAFGNSALQGFSIWQDKGDTSPATLTGTVGSPTSVDALYFPGASITVSGTGGASPNVTSGRVVAQSIALTNSVNMSITP